MTYTRTKEGRMLQHQWFVREFLHQAQEVNPCFCFYQITQGVADDPKKF